MAQLGQAVHYVGAGVNPVWVVPGFGGGLRGYTPLINELAARHEVNFLPSLRLGGYWQHLNHARFPLLGIQAERLAQEIAETGENQAVILGHSMGGAVGRLAGVILSDVGIRVRLIALCSACVHPDNSLALGFRLARKAWGERQYAKRGDGLAQDTYRAVMTEAKDYIGANLRRAAGEGLALARHAAYISTITAPNMDIHYVTGKRDYLFVPLRCYLALERVGPFDMTILDISHDPQYKPREARIVVEALEKEGLLQL